MKESHNCRKQASSAPPRRDKHCDFWQWHMGIMVLGVTCNPDRNHYHSGPACSKVDLNLKVAILMRVGGIIFRSLGYVSVTYNGSHIAAAGDEVPGRDCRESLTTWGLPEIAR